MAINLDAIKNRLSSLKNTNNRVSNIWKPEPGEHQIRIVPYVHNLENPFIDLYFHYNIGKRSILSPVTYGRPDPILEFAEKLKQTGDKEDWLMGRKLEPKMRTYLPVIIRGQESEGVKFWGFGKMIYEELLTFFADEDYGDLSDPKNVRDIVVTVKSAEEIGKSYAETSIRVKPKQTPLTENPAVLEKVKQQPKINELYPEPTYDELKSQLQTWMGTTHEDVVKSSTKNTQGNTSNSEEHTKAVTSSTVASSFDDLF